MVAKISGTTDALSQVSLFGTDSSLSCGTLDLSRASGFTFSVLSITLVSTLVVITGILYGAWRYYGSSKLEPLREETEVDDGVCRGPEVGAELNRILV